MFARMHSRIVSIIAVLAVVACAPAPLRSFNHGILVSEAAPEMRVRIAEDFEYLGPDTFLLGETHEAERHLFVRLEGNEVTAILVFQFEQIVDGVPGRYEFRIAT